jgi:hypothetical protein
MQKALLLDTKITRLKEEQKDLLTERTAFK